MIVLRRIQRRSRTYAKAIKAGIDVSKEFKEMDRTKCRIRGAEYSIVHNEQFADPKAAIRQTNEHRTYIEGEHVDPKNIHLDVYDPLD